MHAATFATLKNVSVKIDTFQNRDLVYYCDNWATSVDASFATWVIILLMWYGKLSGAFFVTFIYVKMLKGYLFQYKDLILIIYERIFGTC